MTPAPVQPPATGVVRGMVGLCSVIVGVSPGWSLISTLGLAFHTQLQISEVGVGLLAALVSLGYVGASLPIGRIVDRSGGQAWLTGASGVLAVLLVALVLIGQVWALAVVALLAGVVWSGCVSATNRYSVVIAPANRRGIVMGIIQATTMIVSGVAASVLPRVATRWTWREAVLLLAAVAVASGVTTGLALRGRHRVPLPVDTRPTRSAIRFSRPFWALLGYGVVMGIAMHCAWTFMLIFLDRRGTSTAFGSLALALLFLFGGVGRLLWGLVVDRGVSPWLLLAVSAVGGAAAILPLSLGVGGVALLLCVAGIGTLLIGHNTVFILAGLRMVPASGWAVAGAALTSSHVVGGMVGPPLFALVVDHGGGYGPAWAAVVVLLVLSVGALWMASRPLRDRVTG